MKGLLSELWGDEAGLTNVEYALVLLLVVLVTLAAWDTLGSAQSGAAGQFSAVLGGR
jgi:Flp pilus assembly pilin Flp